MPEQSESSTSFVTLLRLQPNAKSSLADWQSKLHAEIACVKGFISLEIASPKSSDSCEWMIVQRFESVEDKNAWSCSQKRKKLLDELQPILLKDGSKSIRDEELTASAQRGGVTEVFVTRVLPVNLAAYRDWIAKIHQAEAKFPGFQRVYVQSPRQETEGTWITLLQFDTQENLDRWLHSEERQKILQEGQSMIESLESHRVISPFAGWFSKLPKAPPVWKQTMLILLVLFPIVMIELKYLNPLLAQYNFNSSLGTFIGNAISVSLVSWPFLPISIYFLGWWLIPDANKRLRATIIGTAVVCGLYILEIAVLWRFL